MVHSLTQIVVLLTIIWTNEWIVISCIKQKISMFINVKHFPDTPSYHSDWIILFMLKRNTSEEKQRSV